MVYVDRRRRFDHFVEKGLCLGQGSGPNLNLVIDLIEPVLQMIEPVVERGGARFDGPLNERFQLARPQRRAWALLSIP